MNKPKKLGSKSSRNAETLHPNTEMKKEKQNPSRNPLKDLNCSSSTSVEAPRGCFRFLRSNPSSKATFPKTKSTPKNPQSAPVARTTSSSSGANPRSKPQLKRPSFENLKKYRENGLQQHNDYKTSPEGQFSSTQMHRSSAEIDRGKPPNGRAVFHRRGNSVNKLGSGSSVVSATPEINSFRGYLGDDHTPLNKLSSVTDLASTPDKAENTRTTPPVQASISPEIQCGSSMVSTAACFGAGQMISGISDKRKCRPRGFLTVGEELVVDFSDGCNSSGRVTLIPTPAEASVHWLMPVSEDGKEGGKLTSEIGSPSSVGGVLGSSDGCDNVRISMIPSPPEAGTNWVWTRCGDVKKGVQGNGSPEIEGFVDPMSFVSEGTPSSGYAARISTPTATASPCSWNLDGSEASNRSERLTLRERDCCNNIDGSPFSGDLSGSFKVTGMPLSELKLDRQHLSFWMNMKDLSNHWSEPKSLAEVLQSRSLSSQSPVVSFESNDVLPLPGLDFQFSYSAPLTNYLNRKQFRKSLDDQMFGEEEYCREEQRVPTPNSKETSQVRISWREGLISRIFEMDELDCCQLLSENEETDSCRSSQVKYDFGVESDLNVTSSGLSDEKDLSLTEGFCSPELLCEARVPPFGSTSCAESISTDGGGLVASNDSDWTLCYKNQLFEL